jgi:4-hydroxybenzoate polyprenyltransferase
LTSAIVAERRIPDWRILGWILVAMVGARSAAMTFNRIADRHIDAKNPRTANRAIPKGLVSVGAAWMFTVACAALLVFAAWNLNQLAFYLSPAALLVVLGYSYTKRFTSLSHLVLGLSLGIAPVGAWIAIKGVIELAPLVLAACVMLWTAGFDVIYSLQDVEFDQKMGLSSLPKTLGIANALFLSRLMHIAAIGLLVWFGALTGMRLMYWIGLGVVSIFIVYEHSMVSPKDFSRVNTAFFTMNGCVSVFLSLFTLADVIARR